MNKVRNIRSAEQDFNATVRSFKKGRNLWLASFTAIMLIAIVGVPALLLNVF